MKERKVKWVFLKELRKLAVSAEVEKFDPPSTHKTAMFNNKYTPKPAYLKHSNLPSQLEPWSFERS